MQAKHKCTRTKNKWILKIFFAEIELHYFPLSSPPSYSPLNPSPAPLLKLIDSSALIVFVVYIHICVYGLAQIYTNRICSVHGCCLCIWSPGWPLHRTTIRGLIPRRGWFSFSWRSGVAYGALSTGRTSCSFPPSKLTRGSGNMAEGGWRGWRARKS